MSRGKIGKYGSLPSATARHGLSPSNSFRGLKSKMRASRNRAVLRNMHLNEEFKKKYYENHYIFISYKDLIEGTIKRVYKNIDKYVNGESK